ncbi:hypothetical protein QJS04_geneDACA019709 [Acorus gramineus]|uniref:Uncharacterized protein n=1 Tax=Acorus gramineus TaxID=55184 RepID=A0AAV9BXF2_ACOGR|nr:hypothetical protein QJS04_geneDACA019709 [Acorus gramineus]
MKAVVAVGDPPWPSIAPCSRAHTTKKTLPYQIRLSSSPNPPSKRPNRLRPKLLRILTRKPYLPQQTLETHPSNLHFQSPPPQEPDFETAEAVVGTVAEAFPTVVEGHGGGLVRSLVELSPHFVALFVLQTICAVWLFGVPAADDRAAAAEEEEASEESALPSSEVEVRVSEIRTMAREARERERKERSGREREEEIGVLGEVDRKLVALQKRFRSGRENSMQNSVVDGKGTKDSSEKVKVVRGLSVPKGFGRSKDLNAVGDKRDGKIDLNGSLSSGPSNIGSPSSSPTKEVSSDYEGDERSSSSLGTSAVNTDYHSGHTEDLRNGPTLGGGSSHSTSGMSQSPSNISGKSLTSAQSKMLDMLGKPRTVEKKQDMSKILKNSNSSDDLRSRNSVGPKVKFDGPDNWWQNLPYVYAVLLRRKSDPEAPKGLYCLKMESDSDDRGVSSFTVAFQDRGDATNFCYILESFFEELGDLNADIVPLSIQEIKEEVESGIMKILVVRKRQLHLYAGQPLEDVEMALRSILE